MNCSSSFHLDLSSGMFFRDITTQHRIVTDPWSNGKNIQNKKKWKRPNFTLHEESWKTHDINRCVSINKDVDTFCNFLKILRFFPISQFVFGVFYFISTVSKDTVFFIIKGFRTIVFIFIVIPTTFRPICPLAFFRYLSNSGTFRNFELHPLLISRGSPVLIPLAITGYKC